MIPLKPALQSSEGRFKHWSGAKLVNCFAEKADGDKRADIAVMGIPGLALWATVGQGPYRGHVFAGGVLYLISGNELYAVDEVGGATLLGTIPGEGLARVAANYTEVAIAANGTGYVYSGAVVHTPLDFSVSDVIYADGYIVWAVKDSEQFFISALDDALTYDAADIASVEGFPDNISGMVNDHREVQFYGDNSTEIFYNSGAAAFPFERQGNAFIERGCFDRDSVVKANNSVTFVGDDRIVYTLVGYQPQRISTHAIEQLLSGATYARAFTYAQEGHTFYCLDVDDATVCYDFATGAWHHRASFNSAHWRVNGAISAFSKVIFADSENGKLYLPSFDALDENGTAIAMELYLPTIEASRDRRTMYAFEVVCETGVGNDDARDPQIMLQYSDDGGHLWSNEMWRSMGRVGVYRTRAVWRRLGQFRNRQMKLRITDASRRLVIAYFADIQ